MKHLPVIPESEFKQRREALQARMAEAGVDLLVVNSNDRSTHGHGNIRYLTDFATHFEPSCCLIPRSGESVLVLGPESEALAEITAKIEHIYVAEEYTHPEEEYPCSTMYSLKEIIKKTEHTREGEIRKIGIIGEEFMDPAIGAALKKNYELVSADTMMIDVRSTKSEAEIKVIEYTYKIAGAGLKAALGAIKEGAAEYEVAAEIEYAMRKMGSEGVGIDTMVASGVANSRPIIARTTFRRIKPKEIIHLSIIPKYQGYHAAIGRPVSIGDPGASVVEAAELTVLAQDEMIANLRPGVLGREVENLSRVVMAQKGFVLPYIALHSVGVLEFEPPIFFSKNDRKLEENMIVSVDVPCFLNPWGGFRIEDGYRVTKDGSVPLLDSVQRGLIVLD